jgi:hypothetical protein
MTIPQRSRARNMVRYVRALAVLPLHGAGGTDPMSWSPRGHASMSPDCPARARRSDHAGQRIGGPEIRSVAPNIALV